MMWLNCQSLSHTCMLLLLFVVTIQLSYRLGQGHPRDLVVGIQCLYSKDPGFKPI